MPTSIDKISCQIRQCTLCEKGFTHTPNPIFVTSTKARILIASQAPGRIAHLSGIPFNDRSGERLRDWMGIDQEQFYDEALIAIAPMAFCYPGKGVSGDLPPPSICAATWRDKLLDEMPDIRLTLLIGKHAQDWHLEDSKPLTQRVKDNDYCSSIISLPHPSPRNNIWLKKNEWFESEMVSRIRLKVSTCLSE